MFLALKSPIKSEKGLPETPVISNEKEPQRIEIESSTCELTAIPQSPLKRRSHSSPEEDGGGKKRRVTKPK